MNRKVKFRVWNKKHNFFVSPDAYGYLAYSLHCNGELIHLSGQYPIKIANQDDFIIQQFTGLLDKNGKEIYEGDLVNFYIPGRPHGPEREDFTCEEVWFDENSASFAFGRIYYDGWHGYGTWDVKDLEVVGNIFESPDKVKKISEAALSAAKQ